MTSEQPRPLAAGEPRRDTRAVLRCSRTDVLVVTRLRVAGNMLSRLKGLLGSAEPAPGDGLWIVPCSGVHTVGMRYPIDVVFLDRAGRIVATRPELRPLRAVPWVRHAHSALELRQGAIARCDLRTGDVLVVDPGGTAG
ncbi:MAG: DUF192 domain-containing protein [Dehalococcoidia bacterium]